MMILLATFVISFLSSNEASVPIFDCPEWDDWHEVGKCFWPGKSKPDDAAMDCVMDTAEIMNAGYPEVIKKYAKAKARERFTVMTNLFTHHEQTEPCGMCSRNVRCRTRKGGEKGSPFCRASEIRFSNTTECNPTPDACKVQPDGDGRCHKPKFGGFERNVLLRPPSSSHQSEISDLFGWMLDLDVMGGGSSEDTLFGGLFGGNKPTGITQKFDLGDIFSNVKNVGEKILKKSSETSSESSESESDESSEGESFQNKLERLTNDFFGTSTEQGGSNSPPTFHCVL